MAYDNTPRIDEEIDILGEAEFIDLLLTTFEDAPDSLDLDSNFVEDLGVDSLQMLEIILCIDEVLPAGRRLSLELSYQLETVRSTYLAYLAAGQMPAVPPPARIARGATFRV